MKTQAIKEIVRQGDTYDPFGNSMGVFFNVANEMVIRGLDINPDFGFRCGAGGPYDQSEYEWTGISDLSDAELTDGAALLHRYTELLRHLDLDY